MSKTVSFSRMQYQRLPARGFPLSGCVHCQADTRRPLTPAVKPLENDHCLNSRPLIKQVCVRVTASSTECRPAGCVQPSSLRTTRVVENATCCSCAPPDATSSHCINSEVESGIGERNESARSGGEPMPRHVAMILDGNHRWALKQGLQGSRAYGHEAGVTSLKRIVQCCARLSIPALSVFAFSTENWQRHPAEVQMLLRLMEQTLRHDLNELHASGIRLKFFGELHRLPNSLQLQISRAEELTEQNLRLQVGIALSYGGQQDLVQATRRIASLVANGEIALDDVDASLLQRSLQSSHMCTAAGPPDLLIRTSGEMRLSNFLMWDLAYTELYFTEKLWPDFTEIDFEQAIATYAKRQRRFGKR